MAYCIKCGKQNTDTAKFCTTCGAAMITVNSKTITGATQTVVVPKQASSKILIIAITALVVLGGAGYFIFRNKPGKDSDQKKETSFQAIGRYPYASQRLLTDDDIKNMQQYDLRIMRNEIYARHGFVFQNTDMKNYFTSQSWYTPQYENVIDMLSTVEKNNIAFIIRYHYRLVKI